MNKVYQGLCASLALLLPLFAYADDHVDIQQRLNQQSDDEVRQQVQTTIEQANVYQGSPQIQTAFSLPAQLYAAIQQADWENVAKRLAEYQQLPDADQNLIRYAQAKLAWQRNEFDQSIEGLNQLVSDRPDFILARLELGKALYLDNQNKEALAQFEMVQSGLNPDDPKQQGVYRTIGLFHQALRERDAWHGSASIGYTHASNLNQSSNSKECTHYTIGNIAFDSCRETPKPIADGGIHYEANVHRRFSLSGHHGVSVNALAFGDVYRHQRDYQQHFLGLDASYSYQSARHRFDAGISAQRRWLGSHTEHDAYGVQSNYQFNVSPQTSLSFDASYLYQHYPTERLSSIYDGGKTRVGARVWHEMGNNWAVSAGLSSTYQAAKEPTVRYREDAINLGVYKNFSQGFNTMLQAGLYRRNDQQYSELLEAKRRDTRLRLTAALQAPKWQVWGVYPVLMVEYERNNSNVNWLYSYRNTQVGVRLEKRF